MKWRIAALLAVLAILWVAAAACIYLAVLPGTRKADLAAQPAIKDAHLAAQRAIESSASLLTAYWNSAHSRSVARKRGKLLLDQDITVKLMNPIISEAYPGDLKTCRFFRSGGHLHCLLTTAYLGAPWKETVAIRVRAFDGPDATVPLAKAEHFLKVPEWGQSGPSARSMDYDLGPIGELPAAAEFEVEIEPGFEAVKPDWPE